MWIFRNLFTHSLIDKYMACSELLSIMNKTAKNIYMEDFVWTFSFYVVKYIWVELWHCVVIYI